MFPGTFSLANPLLAAGKTTDEAGMEAEGIR